MNRRSLASLLLAPLAVAWGCSGPTGPKTMRAWGTVSFDGKPIEEGTITFESTEDAPAQGPIRAGAFDIPAASGPVAGKSYLIKVNAIKKTGKTIPNLGGDGAPTIDEMAETIPPAFNAKSTIQRTIDNDPARNEFHFKLMPSGKFE